MKNTTHFMLTKRQSICLILRASLATVGKVHYSISPWLPINTCNRHEYCCQNEYLCHPWPRDMFRLS